jgi:hypothetical protein
MVDAQQSVETARVEQIAGSTIYLNIGSDQGLNKGDTLFVYHDKSYLGSLIVFSTASRLSSARFADQPFSITRGQVLQIKKMTIKRTPVSESKSTEKNTVTPTNTTKSKPVVTSSPRQEYKIKPDITGGVQFGSNLFLSSTHTAAVGTEIIKRTFITTYTGLQSRVRHLPGQFSLDMNMQWNYRYASQQTITPTNAFRIFQFQVNKKFGKSPVNLSVGRFYNYYEPFSGFWDGAMIRIGNESYGFGLISGFDPIRSNEGFSRDLPKSSFFTYYTLRHNRFYSESDLSVNGVFPQISGWNNHFYAGWHQQFRFKGTSLMSNIQVDQNPFNKHYIFSQINLRANINLDRYVTLYGIYNRRRPYRIWQISTPISYLRTQWSGGLSMQLGSNTIGSDVTLNQSDISKDSYTFSGYAYIPRTGFWGLGFNLTANYWTDNTFNNIYVAPGFTKKVGRGQMTMTYRFYRSQYFSRANATHSLSLQYNVSLLRNWYFNTQIQEQYGQLLNNQQVFIGITKNF